MERNTSGEHYARRRYTSVAAMRVVVASVVLLIWVAPAFGQGIVGSKHDFTQGWTTGWYSSNEICAVCHTPHNAQHEIGAPLWNHEVTVQVFTLYSSSTLDAVPNQPSGSSKLCLSCHDGSVALDSYDGNTGTVFWPQGHLDVVGGFGDVSEDHPISFTYDATLALNDGELRDPTSSPSGVGGTIQEDLLSSGTLECSTCHDVHDAAGIDKLLRVSNLSSALCLTCHDK